jgi:hypothetical protein
MTQSHRIIIKTIILACCAFAIFRIFNIGRNYVAKMIDHRSVAIATEKIAPIISKHELTVQSVTAEVQDTIDTNDKTIIPNDTPTNTKLLLLQQIVPFTSQAPYADWEDLRHQDGCEEAAAIMAIYWARNKELSRYEANKTIEALADWELEQYGSFNDTSAQDTVLRIINGYFEYEAAAIQNNITNQDIINALQQDKLILAPTNGQALDNPYFTSPSPLTHMLVITGYDEATNEFITNDPGTKRGENYRYNAEVLFNAINDYPTGDHESISQIKKDIIIISK